MKKIYIALLLTSFLPICAIHAQSQRDKCSGPDNPDAYALPIVYHSSFLGYQGQRPFKLQSWEKSNKAVSNMPEAHSPSVSPHAHHHKSEGN